MLLLAGYRHPPSVASLRAYTDGPDRLELDGGRLADALGFLVLRRHIGR